MSLYSVMLVGSLFQSCILHEKKGLLVYGDISVGNVKPLRALSGSVTGFDYFPRLWDFYQIVDGFEEHDQGVDSAAVLKCH